MLRSEKIDLIISDWNMPKMDGLELLRTIKDYPELATIPFIMITSESKKDKVDEAFKAGVNQYICKPFKPSYFKEKIQQTLGKNLYGSKQVMVVDDSPVIRKIVEKLLRMLGFGGFNFIELDNNILTNKFRMKMSFEQDTVRENPSNTTHICHSQGEIQMLLRNPPPPH